MLLFECERPLAGPMRISLAGCSELQIGRGSKRSCDGSLMRHVTIPDRWLSSKHAKLQNSFGRWIVTDLESKNGSVVNGDPISRRELQDGDIVELGHTFFLFRDGQRPCKLPCQDWEHFPQGPPITLHIPLEDEVQKLERLAQTDISILILGESGCGKEVVANHIHACSKRSGACIAVNCGALPAGLVESELFGHKKGAFTGAGEERKGLVASADKGTLFLDEIADLQPVSQAALLRVLQEREVRQVGATQSQSVDLRTITATHLDIDALVQSGRFRTDLYARISGYRITIPPLRDRPEDIGLLIAVFLLQEKAKHGATPTLSVDVGRLLLQYNWPLNIRELQACLATASILAAAQQIEIHHLPESLRNYTPSAVSDAVSADALTKARLLELLAETKGNISAVAREMGKDRKQIQRWLKRFEIDIQRFRSG